MIGYPTERVDRLHHYVVHGFPSIWSQSVPDAMWLTQRYDVVLHSMEVDGWVAEIGVLRGAFIIGLHQLMPDWACSLAIDCFDLPGYELELPGDRAVLNEYLANVGRCVHRPEKARYIQADSGTLDPIEMAADYGRVVKFFAVDGLHTEARTLHDLHIAEAMLVDGGMIILDDWKPGCREVVDAAERFVSEGRFAPVSCGFNKLWMAQVEFAHDYRKYRLYPECRTVNVYGYSIDQLGPTDPYNPADWFN